MVLSIVRVAFIICVQSCLPRCCSGRMRCLIIRSVFILLVSTKNILLDLICWGAKVFPWHLLLKYQMGFILWLGMLRKVLIKSLCWGREELLLMDLLSIFHIFTKTISIVKVKIKFIILDCLFLIIAKAVTIVNQFVLWELKVMLFVIWWRVMGNWMFWLRIFYVRRVGERWRMSKGVIVSRVLMIWMIGR